MRIVLIVVFSLVLIGGAGYLYASSGIESKPGYVKLVLPSAESVDTQISLNLGPSGVGPVRWLFGQFASHSDRDLEMSERVLNGVLQDLRGVQLRVYDVNNNRPLFDQAISESLASLKGQGWQTLVKVREDDEHVVVMQSTQYEKVIGLSILASTPDKAVFLNLIGPFDPERIAASTRL